MIERAVALLLALAPGAAGADVFTFRTPSGNIACSVGVGEGPSDIRCEIVERGGREAAPRPAGCNGYWGHHFEMFGTGPVRLTCSPRPPSGDGFEVAPYGVTADWGDIVCTSSRQGLTCRNRDGHGFFLSRAEQAVW